MDAWPQCRLGLVRKRRPSSSGPVVPEGGTPGGAALSPRKRASPPVGRRTGRFETSILHRFYSLQSGGRLLGF
jgi:hypothetical protein